MLPFKKPSIGPMIVLLMPTSFKAILAEIIHAFLCTQSHKYICATYIHTYIQFFSIINISKLALTYVCLY